LLSHNEKETIDGYVEWKKTVGKCLDAKDVSDCCLFIYNMPQHCCIREIVVGTTGQPA
jgi:NADP-dependent 3-hydroxy acid dehydrogenase YdfG